MRVDNPRWRKRDRLANDRFEDACAVSRTRKQIASKGIEGEKARTLDRPLYLRKERYVIEAFRMAPDLFHVETDGLFSGMVAVKNRLTGKTLHFPARKRGALGGAV